MIYCAISNWARILKRITSHFLVNLTAAVSIVIWSGLESYGAEKAVSGLRKTINVWKLHTVYDVTPITPSAKRIIIEIQNTGPELPYLYIIAGFEDEWFKSKDMQRHKKNNIKNIKKREELRSNNVLLTLYDLKRVLEEKFPNAIVITTFVSREERIEDARRWPDNIYPLNSPAISKPRIPFADIIVQIDFRQAIAADTINQTQLIVTGSYGALFDITINAYTPESQVVQFSTDYGGLNAEKKLNLYHDSFNKPVALKTIKRIKKKKY